jgi:adenylate cyclase
VLYEACLGQPLRIPDDLGGPILLIDHRGPGSRLTQAAPTFPVIAASELPAIPPALLRDRIVLVGSGVEALGDIFFTPFSTGASGYLATFGVELHATLVAMMLEQRWLRHVPPWLLGLLLAGLLAVVALTSLFWRSLLNFLLGPVLALGWIVLAVALFSGGGLVLPIALPIALAALVFIICQTLLYFSESRYSKFLQTTFGRYMSPQVVAQMVDHSWGLELGGEERNLTILFSDIEGFTTVSEKLHPNQVVALLNEYLGTMTAVLFDKGATIGDFMGDGILAYFGAPLHMPDHAERACRAAVGMQAASVQLNERLGAMGFPPLKTRVGLHTGDVVVGNIGSDQRRDFTVIGDAVNLASRLEGVNKFFGTRVVMSEQTRRQAPPAILTRELGRIVVKGKTQPVTLYEALGIAGQQAAGQTTVDQATQARYDTYAQGLQRFYAGNFPEAEGIFRRLAEAGDAPAAYLAEQAAALQATPPAGEWHGALTLTAK